MIESSTQHETKARSMAAQTADAATRSCECQATPPSSSAAAQATVGVVEASAQATAGARDAEAQTEFSKRTSVTQTPLPPTHDDKAVDVRHETTDAAAQSRVSMFHLADVLAKQTIEATSVSNRNLRFESRDAAYRCQQTSFL